MKWRVRHTAPLPGVLARTTPDEFTARGTAATGAYVAYTDNSKSLCVFECPGPSTGVVVPMARLDWDAASNTDMATALCLPALTALSRRLPLEPRAHDLVAYMY